MSDRPHAIRDVCREIRVRRCRSIFSFREEVMRVGLANDAKSVRVRARASFGVVVGTRMSNQRFRVDCSRAEWASKHFRVFREERNRETGEMVAESAGASVPKLALGRHRFSLATRMSMGRRLSV